MRVLVIGAGIGGLTLAHALRHAGIDVAVYDRDPAAEATGGYRLRLDDRACDVLARHLAPARYQALLASSAGPRSYRRFNVTDHRLRLLFAEPRERGSDNLLIGRIPLRRLLAGGLGDAVRFGTEFTGHTTGADGVTAHFADGTRARGDVLVGADGVGSRVAAALASRPTSAPAGVCGVAGRTPLTGTEEVPALLETGPALAFGPGGVGVFLTKHDPAAGTIVDPAACTEVPAIVESPCVIWGLLAPDEAYPEGTRGLGGAALIGVADGLLDGWSETLRALVRSADPEWAAYFRFHAADPDGDLTPWPAGPVTAIGDAVHAMPPTGGQAAITAIRDADMLAGELVRAAAGESTAAMAVHRYQQRMAGYAAAAVRESLQPLTWTRRLAGPAGTRIARVALPAMAGLRRVLVGARGA
ncbi:FAD-dependent oxidoreductase [Amycolatopsis suaedae]|uniref:FAD-dependent monooxygenase n=1 Tax=Amycolatopsis suaedae TaxID=2510978 RepID=A0A4Q7J782_9PSEU|nr:NAD(P)/FAD-dependent oxidoreductase [Amycolatopsis suaedae]RZQ63027.1 FAD-dependent monooxygenase [Amycolatopsis suaedae]